MAARKHKYGYSLTIFFCLVAGGWLWSIGEKAIKQFDEILAAAQATKAPTKELVPSMTSTNLLIEICKSDIREPIIVWKQAMLETQNLTCDNCSLSVNNLFGFRTQKGYIRFQTWVDSVKYYKTWQDERLREGENYFAFLKRIGYAEDPLYVEKVKSIKF